MQAGISSYTYTWAIGVPGKEPKNPMTIYQLMEKAVEFDVSVVQIADNVPLHKFSEKELLEIRKMANENKLQIEVGARGMTSENLTRYIELARFFSSSILRFVIDESGFQPDMEEIHSIIQKVIRTLEKNNIVLAIENHDRILSHEFEEMISIANSPCVAICLDSVNSLGAGEGLETVIERLAPLTANLHVKEFIINRVFHNMGFTVEGCPLGKGMLPLEKMLSEVPATCTTAILEQWTPPEETLEKTIEKENEWAKESIHKLKKVIKSTQL